MSITRKENLTVGEVESVNWNISQFRRRAC